MSVLSPNASPTDIAQAIVSGDRGARALCKKYTDEEVYKTIVDMLHDPLGFVMDQALDKLSGEQKVPTREEVLSLAAVSLLRVWRERKLGGLENGM